MTSRRLSGWLTQIMPVVIEQIVIPEKRVIISPKSGIKEIDISLAANKPPTIQDNNTGKLNPPK